MTPPVAVSPAKAMNAVPVIQVLRKAMEPKKEPNDRPPVA